MIDGLSRIAGADFRGRTSAAVGGVEVVRAAAPLFQVSIPYLYKALIRRWRTGASNASSRSGHRMSELTPVQEATTGITIGIAISAVVSSSTALVASVLRIRA